MSPRAALIPGIVSATSEGDLQSQVLAYLALLPGVVFRRTNSGLARSLSGNRIIRLAPLGTPDITGHMPDGRALYIELKDPKAHRPVAPKTEKGKRDLLTWQEQEKFIAAAAAAGCVAFRASSLQEVADRLVAEIERGRR